MVLMIVTIHCLTVDICYTVCSFILDLKHKPYNIVRAP